ncbi:spore coat U domain-containing protein [Phyllobacterium sp.]|uniref:Csu type fimbrial protein n=3 Tax=Pseudomonadota TaxID=1224 RepID=UPI001AC27577|nr:spore coat protein U domain-containing protein [Phyllobacterium sp.]MBQ9349725.1 spore coat protein U domain-containing protein [Phyllobacterium sp.]
MPSPSPARREPAILARALKIIILRRWFLALSVLTVLLSISPASAQVCSVKSMESLGTVKIADLISNASTSASTTAKIIYECPQDVVDMGGVICAYIEDNNGNVFYQGQPQKDSSLAWEGKFKSPDSNQDNVGAVKLKKGSRILEGRMDLTATYLPRANQSRVRAGTYTSTYSLVSVTYNDNTGEPDCYDLSKIKAHSRRVTTPFQLQAEVLTTCQLENKGEKDTFDPIDFGTRGALSAADAGAGAIRATTNIDVRCTYETPYTLDLGDGENFKDGTRRMKNGDNFLAYQLFNKTASGESSPWSKLSGIGNTVNTVNKHTVEGRLTTPIAVAPAKGTYEDRIVVTLTF